MVEFSGVIRGPSGVPVSGAKIIFKAIETSESVLKDTFDHIITDGFGGYSVGLEYGIYQVDILNGNNWPDRIGIIEVNKDTAETDFLNILS